MEEFKVHAEGVMIVYTGRNCTGSLLKPNLSRCRNGKFECFKAMRLPLVFLIVNFYCCLTVENLFLLQHFNITV